MSSESWAFGTLNAKRMSPAEVADSSVMPDIFREIAGLDHCYLVGPRGSGKTTMLRMLHGESLAAWLGRGAKEQRERITYSGIFLPSDELWASQAAHESARAAFAIQMLLAFLDSIEYRAGRRSEKSVHHPVKLTALQESQFVSVCADGWGIRIDSNSILALQGALDLALLRVNDLTTVPSLFKSTGTLELLRFGVRAFNRIVSQTGHRWALLLDEVELAPRVVHTELQQFVRGGSGELILKVSTSPFDRYMNNFVNGVVAPSQGNDFRVVHLSGQSRKDVWRFTEGLWIETLRSHGFPSSGMTHSFSRGEAALGRDISATLKRAKSTDPGFAAFLRRHSIDPDNLEALSYNLRSATIRKVYPLVVFREALITFRNGRPVRRSRKKQYEPFTGARAVATALEGNPRWIKSAFSEMIRAYDPAGGVVGRGFQLDALRGVSNRFEALLHVLPRTESLTESISVPALVDAIADFFSEQNLGEFTPEPPNCFTADPDLSKPMQEALSLALYAGAIVHVRDRRSSPVLSDMRSERFRLAYVLGVRDNKEFPLRLGKDASLSRIVAGRDLRRGGKLPSRPKAKTARNVQGEFDYS